MWQVVVLARFEAIRGFLSANERQRVRTALFGCESSRGDAADGSTSASGSAGPAVEATTGQGNTEATEAAGGDSAHLQRWKQWKLESAQIERLTATAAGPGADGTLRALEATVGNLRFFARGKRGVLFAGEVRATNLPVVAKFAADATSAGSVTLEARWLRVVNRMGIGARLLDAGPGWFLCERLDGRNVVEFLSASDDTATRANALWVVREMLCQCFAMDLMGVNKEEMTHPHRHILIHRSSQSSERWRCTFVDFEKCSTTKKPKNVTQLCQFLSSPRMVGLLASKRVSCDVPRLRQCTKRYKQRISTQTFGDVMRVFGL